MSAMPSTCIRGAALGVLLFAHTIVLEATHGGIVQITEGADTIAVGTSPDPWLWIAHRSPDDAGRTRPPITPAQAGRFVPTLSPGPTPA
jgi:hypothetical protein